MEVTATDELSFHVSPDTELLNPDPIWAVDSELLLLLEGGGVEVAAFAEEAAGGVLEVEIGEAAADVGIG